MAAGHGGRAGWEFPSALAAGLELPPAGLVRQLQEEVLKYRTRCQELEQLLEAGWGGPSRLKAAEDRSLEKALLQVEQEQERCENLVEMNTLLREHLDKANYVNSALREDVGKLMSDWMRAREELELKNSEWRNERELYDSYLRGEHNRLLSLWCQVVAFRRHFLEMKTATDRDLSELKAEQMRLSGSILVNCSRLTSAMQLWESVTVSRPTLKDQAQEQVGQELNQECLQVQEDLEKKMLQERVMELSALLAQSQKQKKTMKTLNDPVENLEVGQLEKEYETSLTKSVREENISLRKLIKDIIEMVLDDNDSTVITIRTDDSQQAEASNILSCLCSVDAEHAFVLVQEALSRKQRETQALKEELSARQDSLNALLHQHREQEEKCRKLQQRLEQQEEECKMCSNQHQHLQSLVEAHRSDCVKLEKTREELQQHLELMKQEASRLHRSNTELQLKEDAAQGEKMEQQQTIERVRRDQDLLLKDVAVLEGKHALLQSELVVARETLEELHLQRDLLKEEKRELTMALEKSEESVAELTGAQKTLSAEIADLRAATVKMGGISEALALDKVQLNKLLLQLEQEKEVLSCKVDELERAKILDQEKLNSYERTNEELCAEKAHLEQLLKKAKECQERLQVELRILAEQKADTQEKLSQICRQQELSTSALEQMQQDSSRQGHALAKVSEEKEFLVLEKAALEVQLAALERDRQGLSEELAEARSVKETLESSLFETQHNLSQLEITRSHLEIQLHTVTQAKEVIQGEVKCLQWELETERSLMKQERENLAQQLLQTEQKYDNTLRLWQTDHEEERNKLLQDLAREQEGHHSELQKLLEQWEKEKAETEWKHEKKLSDMKQRVATMQAQQEQEQTRVENAKQEILLEKEREKKDLLETLLQSQGELREACQQLEQLRLDMELQRDNGQNVTEKLQAELQEMQSKIKAVERKHKEEIKTVKEEMNILLQQRDALQKQVEELTSQIAASKESQQVISCKAQQDLSEAYELSRQKVLEIVHLQKILEEKRSQCEEVDNQNKELQVRLQFLEGEKSRWEDVERQNTEFQALLKVLESEKDRLTVSLKEKEISLRTLEENNLAQHNELSQMLSALHQAQQLHSDHRRELQELNNQVQTLQEVVLEKEAGLAAREKQLLQNLEESRAAEQFLKDSLHLMEAEMSELRLRLYSTENRAKALATECQQVNSAHCEARSQLDKLNLDLHHEACDSRDLVPLDSEQGHTWDVTVPQARDLTAELTVDRVAASLHDLCQHLKQTQQDLNNARKKMQELELELSEQQAEKDLYCTHNEELQKQLAQSQKETQMAECKKAALQEEAAALKEETMTLRQEVSSLEKKLENTEKQRKDVLNEWDKLQALKEKLVWEIEFLQESVTMSEIQANTATDMNHCLEQELQATLSILKLKNEEVELLWDKIHMLQKEAAQRKVLQENITHLTAVLSEREGEMELYQEQINILEKQKEMHGSTLDQVTKDIAEKNWKIECQQEWTQELEKWQEMERTVVSKVGKTLEERNQAKCQEEKIRILEQHSKSQVRNLLVDLDHMKGYLKKKNLELMSLTPQIQELDMEREEVQSLHMRLQHLKEVLEDRESECESERDQLRVLQHYKEQQEGYVQELHGKLEKVTHSLSEKDQELESQQKQIQEAEEDIGMQYRTICDQPEQTTETLKEKDRFTDIQNQQTWNSKLKTEEWMNILHQNLEYTMAIVKEKDFVFESQKELTKTFQKQEHNSEQQEEIPEFFQVALKKKGQEIVSLRKPCEACKEKDKKAKQRNLQATKWTLKKSQKQIGVMDEAIPKFQQQEEAAMLTKAILQNLGHMESPLEDRDQEIVYLQEYVQDLQEQEFKGKQAKSRQHNLNNVSQILKNNHLEFLSWTEQINVFQHSEETMKTTLSSSQKQANLLEEAMRKQDEDNKIHRQKFQSQEELKMLQTLQHKLTKKNKEATHHREQEEPLEKNKAQGGQKQLEEEISALQEGLHHVQRTLTKKYEEIKNQRERVRCLEKTLIGREQELRRQIQLPKQLISAQQWKDEGETLQQKHQKWEEEEAEMRKVLQERKYLLKRQQELSKQLEGEQKAEGEELEKGNAILKQNESTKIEWKEKAEALSLALTKSEMANGTLRAEITILQSMVSEKDKDQSCFQWTTAGQEQLSWLSEKRLLSQRLECLQQAVARLELEKTELKELNAELKKTLEQVECERRRLKRYCSGQLLADACGFSVSDPHKTPASIQEESHECCSHQLAELQNQVSLLQVQLAQEQKHKQDYIKRCAKTSQELSDLHQELSYSLAAVVREPKATVLEVETQKLDQSLNLNLALMSMDQQSPERQLLCSTARSKDLQ